MIDPVSRPMSTPVRANTQREDSDSSSFLEATSQRGGSDHDRGSAPLGNQDEDLSSTTSMDPTATDSTQGVLEAMQWRERMATTMQIEVRDVRGESEIVSLPWRLIANAAVAQNIGGCSLYAQSPADIAALTQASALLRAGTAATAQMSASAGYSAANMADSAMTMFGASAASLQYRAMHGNTAADALSADAAPQPALAQWLMRWIKWIERDGHAPALWLRDFRMDDAQTVRIVDALRSFASEQGLSLERIVVNGREYWRAPHLHTLEEPT
jgi:hypothetical protein